MTDSIIIMQVNMPYYIDIGIIPEPLYAINASTPTSMAAVKRTISYLYLDYRYSVDDFVKEVLHNSEHNINDPLKTTKSLVLNAHKPMHLDASVSHSRWGDFYLCDLNHTQLNKLGTLLQNKQIELHLKFLSKMTGIKGII